MSNGTPTKLDAATLSAYITRPPPPQALFYSEIVV